MFLSEWRELLRRLVLQEKNFMTARVSMLLKSRVSLTYFRACFLPGRAKDLSAPRYKPVNVFKGHNLRYCLDSTECVHKMQEF